LRRQCVLFHRIEDDSWPLQGKVMCHVICHVRAHRDVRVHSVSRCNTLETVPQ